MAATPYQPVDLQLCQLDTSDDGSSVTDSLLSDVDEKQQPLEFVPTSTSPGHRRLLDLLKATAVFLVPSFLRSSHAGETRPNSSLAALDGLRGLACICVMNQHYTAAFTDRVFRYGFHSTPEDVHVPQWPFIKVFFAGSAQVFTFFVLSGYVLSVKPLRQMRSQDPAIFTTLTSSVFRRGMRLFLPSIAIMAIVAVLGQMGMYAPALAAQNAGLIATPEIVVMPYPTAWGMFTQFLADVQGMTKFYDWGGYMPSLNQHLWTINVEFRSSMLLYLVQIGTARLRSWLRILTSTCLVVYMAYAASNHVLLFFW